MAETAAHEDLKVLISAEQIQKRVREMGRQVTEQYRGKTLHIIGVLDDAFIFMSDLVRAIEIPTLCGFLKPRFNESPVATGQLLTIFFSPEIAVQGHHVVLVEAVISTGLTAEFLMRNLLARGAASVKLMTLLDKQTARSVLLQPDYLGFLVKDDRLVGYGLGGPQLWRNLPYIATMSKPSSGAGQPS